MAVFAGILLETKLDRTRSPEILKGVEESLEIFISLLVDKVNWYGEEECSDIAEWMTEVSIKSAS
ncbi:hypothetical protein [Celeribacter ethanolicus]|uniref:hypothetical protein n=1 Tax=Celeribacter ethanolicus TaxID=1758178 RepID=UPI0012FE11F9|nr:hypothetical protein [Celeribacter ethanolicus]